MSAKWIWENTTPQNDEYADFRAEFTAGTEVSLQISADSNYAVYLNGTLAAFGQYGDYPHYKVYDEVDLTPFCRPGKNTMTVTVWYYGMPSSVYYPGKAGVCFTVYTDGKAAVQSGADTLCRKNPNYAPHREKIITRQLGFSFLYDANPADCPWHPAVLTGYEAELHPRPNDKLILGEECPGVCIGGNRSTHFLLDLGKEEVGFLSLSLESDTAQTVTVAYGEHIKDGCVRQKVGGRDFSVEYVCRPGENEYMNPFRRLGCRYLEIFCGEPIRLHKAAIVPTLYPLSEVPFDAGSPLRQRIYDVSVRTLRLCMHEHYEDCPWREQALYAMDSRNQMIAGYYAFREYRFPRSCLSLMAQDRRQDKLLSITYPHGGDLAIPSFSLHYFTEMLEYTEYSGDTSLIRESWDKLCSVLSAFTDRIRDGLVYTFEGDNHWNFYEWSDGLSGSLRKSQVAQPDLPINCLTVRALQSMEKMAAKIGMPFEKKDLIKELQENIYRTFWQKEEGVFSDLSDKRQISELGNSLAILAGAVSGAEADALAQKLTDANNGMVQITLSMKCFLYDALLMLDRGRYADWILADIDTVYKKMLDADATSFWETELGEADFANAGSLCHGWSAMPAYYYHILLNRP